MSPAAIARTEDNFDDLIAQCADSVMESIRSDYTLRFPKTEAERQNRFAVWLSVGYAKYRPLIQEKWLEIVGRKNLLSGPSNLQESQESTSRMSYGEAEVWQRVKSFLLSSAILFCASDYVRRNFGDAKTLGAPEFDGVYWVSDLGVLQYGQGFGKVVLDENGTVVKELTSTRNEILKKLDDRTAIPAQTTDAA